MANWSLFGIICWLILMFKICVGSGNYGRSFLTSFLDSDESYYNESYSLTFTHGQGLMGDVEVNYTYNGTSKMLTLFGLSIEEEFNSSFAKRQPGLNGNTLHVISSAGVSVVLHGTNQDSSLLLPEDGFGSEYYLPFFMPNGGSCFYAVYAVHDNTTVVTTSPHSTVVWNDTSYGPGQIIYMDLNSHDTALLMGNSSQDLTTTLVLSNKPVGVSVWVEGASVPSNESLPEMLGNMAEAISPKQSWGKSFVVFPLAAGREQGEIIRVLGSRSTNVTFKLSTGDVFHKTVDINTFTEVDTGNLSSRNLIITSEYPLLVVLYSKSVNHHNITTTPFMTELPPLEQWRNSYTFTFPSSVASSVKYINVISHVNDTSGITLTSQSGLAQVSVYRDWETAVDPFQGKIFEVRDNATYTLSHTTASSQFVVLMYGYNSVQSFGNPAGRNVARLYGYCSPTPTLDGDCQDNDCDGRVDEELLDGVDNDGDGNIDEDLALNVVEVSSSLELESASSLLDLPQTASYLLSTSMELASLASSESASSLASTSLEQTSFSLSFATQASAASLLYTTQEQLTSSVDSPYASMTGALSEFTSIVLQSPVSEQVQTSSTVTFTNEPETPTPEITTAAFTPFSTMILTTNTYTSTATVNLESSVMISIGTTETGKTQPPGSIHESEKKVSLIAVLITSVVGPMLLGVIVTVVYTVITKVRATKMHILARDPEQKPGLNPKEIGPKRIGKDARKIFVQPRDTAVKTVNNKVIKDRNIVLTPIQGKRNIDF